MIVIMNLFRGTHWGAVIIVCISVGLLVGAALGQLPKIFVRHPGAVPSIIQASTGLEPQKPFVPSPTANAAFVFPQGGRQLLPAYRLVALYGSPGMAALGVLGRQDAGASITAVKTLASEYQPYTTQKIYPTFEIIATVASGPPTNDNDYSQERDASIIEPWVIAAKQNGVYVILDLQPGREDFLSQAKQYESLLKEPNVGLALDPEWRLKPDQVHLKQIGSVDIAEVNAVAKWLSDLTLANELPQKVFLLHQFKVPMLSNRSQLDTSHAELAYMIQMDGQGSQQAKLGTWQAILANPPAGVYFGWKNFYAKDNPLLTPQQTMQLTPQPWYISYQ